MTRETGLKALLLRSVLQIVRRPIYWVGFFAIPLFIFLFVASMMQEGLPQKIPAAIVDLDHTQLSRSITQNLDGMQMVDLAMRPNSFTEARHALQEGKIYGYFLIPRDLQADVASGRPAAITFYTNTTYFVPAALLFKTFKSTAIFTKAGLVMEVLESAGGSPTEIKPLIQPVNIVTRPLGNPELNYAIYLSNSFIPCALQLMILLMTCFSIGSEVKHNTSRRWLGMADGSIWKAMFAKLLPQTVIWIVVALFMEIWLYKFNGYPMNGSWGWLTLSEIMFVLATQSLGVFFYGILPNLRMSLSVSSLIGILSFSIAAFSFPVSSMYSAVGIFSWIVPTRYNFLIYVNEALNGIDIYYSRIWFAAYIVFMLLPFTVMWRIKRVMQRPVYAP